MKLGKTARARQELESDLHDVCELAKRSNGDPDKYAEAHLWMNDLITQLEKHKSAG